MTTLKTQIYQIKVTLLDTEPPISRRLLVPANVTLEHLHDILQAAMGWQNCHLHEFQIGERTFGDPDWEEDVDLKSRMGDETNTRLYKVLNQVGATALYIYDFGDNWVHEITVENCLLPQPRTLYPMCVAGAARTA